MIKYEKDAIEYIAKIADGGMRDAITLLDKCLAYSKDLTLNNVVKALGFVDYDIMWKLFDSIINRNMKKSVEIIESIHANGKDLKTFVRSFVQFLLDICKYNLGCDWRYISMPRLLEYEDKLNVLNTEQFNTCDSILNTFIKLNSDIKYSTIPKYDIEATIFQCMIQED